MTISIKNLLFSFYLLSSMATHSMELPQQNNDKPIERDVYLLHDRTILDKIRYPIFYKKMLGVENHLNIPYVTLIMCKTNTQDAESILEVPLTSLLGCDYKYEDEVTVNSKSSLNDKGTLCTFLYRCCKDPNSSAKTLKEELNILLNEFLQSPHVRTEDKELFINHKIIVDTEIINIFTTNGFSIRYENIYEPGENSFKDAKTLEEHIIRQEITLANNNITPDNNIFNNLMKRQLGGKSTKIRPSSLPTPKKLEAPKQFPKQTMNMNKREITHCILF